MTHLTGHQRLVRHRICLGVVSVGCTACAAISLWKPELAHVATSIGLATNLLWIWS